MTTLVERHNAKARRDVEKRQSGGMSRAEGWRRRGPLLPALIFTIIVTQVPFLFTIWYSLQNWNLLNPEGDRFVWFSNYVEIFADSTFRQAALNSVIFTLGCVFSNHRRELLDTFEQVVRGNFVCHTQPSLPVRIHQKVVKRLRLSVAG